MTRLLEAELIKLRTTRTFAALAGVAIGLSLLITVLVSILTEPSQDDVLTDVFTSDASSLFILILAVLGITGEWRHRTITSSLLAAPDRLRFLAAKTLAFAAAGVVLSLLIAIAIGIVGVAILTIRDLPTPGLGEWIEQVGRNALVAALLGRVRRGARRARSQPGRGHRGRARDHLRRRLGSHLAAPRGGPLQPLQRPAHRGVGRRPRTRPASTEST